MLHLMDEMHIKTDLVHDRFSGKAHNLCNLHVPVCFNLGALLGFTNLGDIDVHLTWFEESLQSDSQNPSLANTVFMIMVSGYPIFMWRSTWRPLCFFPMFWGAVARLREVWHQGAGPLSKL